MASNQTSEITLRAEELLTELKSRKNTLAIAESCTGGLIAASVTSVPGSSGVFERGFVTYSNAAKVDMLGVRQATISKYGAVSTEVAEEMSQGAIVHSEADVSIAVTGVAGPGGSESKPEGLVCFAATMDGYTSSWKFEFGAVGRSKVREEAVRMAIVVLRELRMDEPWRTRGNSGD